jgi:integrase
VARSNSSEIFCPPILESDQQLREEDLPLCQHVQGTDGSIVTTPTKTGSERDADLPDIAADALRQYLEAKGKAMPKTPLFSDADGKPLTVVVLRRAWNKARDAAGLPDYTLYSTKHTELTLAAQNGATTEELRTLAGHKTHAAALVYQQFAKEPGRVIADGLDRSLASLKTAGF